MANVADITSFSKTQFASSILHNYEFVVEARVEITSSNIYRNVVLDVRKQQRQE